MISSISWVPKGASKSVPSVADPPSKEEIEEIKKLALLEKSSDVEVEEGNEDISEEGNEDMSDDEDVTGQGEEVERALGAASALGKGGSSVHDIADGLDELNMDEYDEEDDAIELFGSGIGDTYYPSNELDPYLKDKNDEDSEEIEDIMIKADDAVVVCAHNEDDVNHLLVCIVEDPDGDSNMYVHHEILIPAFPLCTAWLDCPIKGGEKGNFIAVGSMEPEIEIWDLDIIDEVQPSLTLGGIAETKKKKKGKKVKKSVTYKEDSHTGAVLALAWNKGFRNILASGSADKTVKIWDVSTGKCKLTMDHHTDKVQAVAWNHHEHEVLLSGSFDHTVVMRDGRVPSHSGFKWSVTADVESLAWNPHDQHLFVASLENGTVVGFDIRTATSNSSSDSKTFTIHAHDKAVCAISYNPLVPNLLATGSEDKMVKLWDLSNNQPSCIASQNRKAGSVFTVSFSEDSPFLLALAGSKGNLELWDTLSDAAVSKRYGKYARQNKAPSST
ncbi:putative transcription factor WD40-like family [Helianthus annuus]|nr:putative transcription factor WD40-like family [Helianthus annuus]